MRKIYIVLVIVLTAIMNSQIALSAPTIIPPSGSFYQYKTFGPMGTLTFEYPSNMKLTYERAVRFKNLWNYETDPTAGNKDFDGSIVRVSDGEGFYIGIHSFYNSAPFMPMRNAIKQDQNRLKNQLIYFDEIPTKNNGSDYGGARFMWKTGENYFYRIVVEPGGFVCNIVTVKIPVHLYDKYKPALGRFIRSLKLQKDNSYVL